MKEFLLSLSSDVKATIKAFVTSSSTYNLQPSENKNGLNIFGIKALNASTDVESFVTYLTENKISHKFFPADTKERFDSKTGEKLPAFDSGILYIGKSKEQSESDVDNILGI